MTCREFDELVHSVVRMELLDVRAREAMVEHSAVCPNCAGRMAEAIALADALDARGRQVREAQAPARMESEVIAAFRAHHRRSALRRTIEWAAAGAAAAILLLFLWTAHQQEKNSSQPAQRKPAPSQSSGPLNAQGQATDSGATLAADAGEDLTAESAQDSSAGGTYTAADFVPVPYTGVIASDDPGMVVRVQMTRASLAQLGYPVVDEPDEDMVRADVLVDEDGWPRGVKLVQ
jgi:hypothetical protein